MTRLINVLVSITVYAAVFVGALFILLGFVAGCMVLSLMLLQFMIDRFGAAAL